jgi:hypothetical protein
MEARINRTILVPPSNSISNMLRVSGEITVEFITEIGFRRGGKCRQIIEDVVTGRGPL